MSTIVGSSAVWRAARMTHITGPFARTAIHRRGVTRHEHHRAVSSGPPAPARRLSATAQHLRHDHAATVHHRCPPLLRQGKASRMAKPSRRTKEPSAEVVKRTERKEKRAAAEAEVTDAKKPQAATLFSRGCNARYPDCNPPHRTVRWRRPRRS